MGVAKGGCGNLKIEKNKQACSETGKQEYNTHSTILRCIITGNGDTRNPLISPGCICCTRKLFTHMCLCHQAV